MPCVEVNAAKAYRTKLGLSQAEFANRFGLPLQSYVQWERDRRTPELAAKILLAVIVEAPDVVISIARRNQRREYARRLAGERLIAALRSGNREDAMAAIKAM